MTFFCAQIHQHNNANNCKIIHARDSRCSSNVLDFNFDARAHSGDPVALLANDTQRPNAIKTKHVEISFVRVTVVTRTACKRTHSHLLDCIIFCAMINFLFVNRLYQWNGDRRTHATLNMYNDHIDFENSVCDRWAQREQKKKISENEVSNYRFDVKEW